jgi:hypothetical protein
MAAGCRVGERVIRRLISGYRPRLHHAAIGRASIPGVASRAERAMSFGGVADDYDRLRRGPPEAIDGRLPQRCQVAVDLSSGDRVLSGSARYCPCLLRSCCESIRLGLHCA